MSRSYIHAIAGKAGINLALGREFDYGFDGTFREVVLRGKRRVETGFPLDFQLKCTTNWNHEGDQVAYSVETKTYNDFVTRHENAIGAVLILLCVPADAATWVEVTEDAILLRHCCYYCTLSGAPVANENSKKKILIPRANILDPDSLQELMRQERERQIGGDQ